jgi:glutamate carboxypeptidase
MARSRFLVLAAAATLLSARPAPGPGLTPQERKIVAAVDRGAPGAMELLRRTVDMNSGTMNLEGVREVGRVFAFQFEALGFETRWVDGAAWGRAGHLVATRPGRGRAPRLLLIGHLDTVFERDSRFQRFEALSDSTARGPGIIDMKGGDVVMLLALRALKDAGALDRLSVTVVLTGDEEKAGTPLALSRGDLIAAAGPADVAIGFEDGDGDPRHAVISRRGASGWVMHVKGTAAHSSQVFRPDIGSGAIYEAARLLGVFRDSLLIEPFLTLNPGLVVGGTTLSFDPEASRGTAFGKTNVVAESTVVNGDLRCISIEQRERAKDIMRGIVERSSPHTEASITFEDGYPPLSSSNGNRALLAIYDRASRDLGLGPVDAVDPARAGAADVSFTEGLVDMAIDGIGMRGDGGHTADEIAWTRSLASQAKRAALLMARLPSTAATRGGRQS